MSLKEIKIVHEEKNFAVLNKPAGVLVHPLKVGDNLEGTLAGWAVDHYPEIKKVGDVPTARPGIVHRLDRETSGVLVIARTQLFFEYLKKQFQAHEVKKTYLALVWGRLKEKGTINKPIGLRSGSTKRSVRARNMKMVKDAVTDYETIEYLEHGTEKFTWARLFPKTGRTHQLRVHLASIGCSVVGDALYGREGNPFGLKRHALHAESIEFVLPKGRSVRFEAAAPDDLVGILEQLRAEK